MFHAGGDDVLTETVLGHRCALDHPVITLGTPTGEDNLAGLDSHQFGNLLPSLFQQVPSIFAEVMEAAGVPPDFLTNRIVGLQNFRCHLGCGTVVKVNH